MKKIASWALILTLMTPLSAAAAPPQAADVLDRFQDWLTAMWAELGGMAVPGGTPESQPPTGDDELGGMAVPGGTAQAGGAELGGMAVPGGTPSGAPAAGSVDQRGVAGTAG